MLHNIRHVLSVRVGRLTSLLTRRSNSYLSQHSVFPATLYNFQAHRKSELFDKRFKQDDWEYVDGVEVSDDGLVHPNPFSKLR